MPGSPQARNTYMPNEKCLRHSQLHGPGLLERENRETERERERERQGPAGPGSGCKAQEKWWEAASGRRASEKAYGGDCKSTQEAEKPRIFKPMVDATKSKWAHSIGNRC